MPLVFLCDPQDVRAGEVRSALSAHGLHVDAVPFRAAEDAAIDAAASCVLLDDGSKDAVFATWCWHRRGDAGRSLIAVTDGGAPHRRSVLATLGPMRAIDLGRGATSVAAEIAAIVKPVPQVERPEAKILRQIVATTVETVRVMLDAEATHVGTVEKHDYHMDGEITGLIHLRGGVEQIMAVNMDDGTALRIAVAFLKGCITDPAPDLVADTICELVNIIAGQVGTVFSGTDLAFQIGIPSVIRGTDHELRHRAEMPCLVAQFDSPFGRFGVQICARPRD